MQEEPVRTLVADGHSLSRQVLQSILRSGGYEVTSANRGKPLLVNLWATWCAPCVAEMPTLDTLAAKSGERMTVIAVAQDLQGGKVVDPWFKKAGLSALQPYLDPENGLLDAANSALPTSIFYDAEGRELWRVVGAIDWQGDEAKALLAEAN